MEIDFSQCDFLRPNAIVFLGGLARLIESRFGVVVFDWNSLTSDRVRTNLMQNGFAGKFGYPSPGWSGNSIPYREDSTMDANAIMDYLTDCWIGRGWVNISQRLRDAIVGKMWEIYNNAFEHADSPIGIFSCGQHFPRRNELVLSVIDFGHGIAANVRNFLNQDPRASQLKASQCLRWAFQPGNTTRPNGMARGMGLDLLKQFIQLNHGKLEVYSNEGYVIINANGENFDDRQTFFEGTIFHITLICDESYYQFADETEPDLPFWYGGKRWN
ncbi:ATP-binding protein [candidate division KSB1 bacterium]|nr:ATP-binding protein [candidate division KSB1 bacterium]